MSPAGAPQGIVCALATPFNKDETADVSALRRIIEVQVEKGTHGLFPLGTTGEGILLTPRERMAVAEAVIDHAGGRIPVVVHCGAPDTKTAAELARHAADIGADAVATVAPYYFSYGPDDLFRHFVTVAEASPSTANYVYENPEVVGYSIGVPTVTRLVNEVPNIRGIKDTGDSIGRLQAYLAQPGTAPEVYVGNNMTILPALVIGARGSVSALANAVPELLVGLFRAFQEGDLDRARALQRSLARVHLALSGLPYVGGVKHLMERRGLPAGATRAPQPSMTPDQAGLIEERLRTWDELEPWLEAIG
jgi:2-dehydro-3-deoxy-phosphogluconate/2-dehydro-3-deoxy-6-phosphogalactonate aldolase